MRGGSRVSLFSLLLLACSVPIAPLPYGHIQQIKDAATQNPASAQPQDEARSLYHALNDLRADAARVYVVHDLNLRRDAIKLKLSEGKLAFYSPLRGQITGAVFTGRGRVIATPPAPGERRSLAQFLGVPILDETFSRAILRFDDDTASEIEQELRGAGAEPTSDPEFARSWDAISTGLNPWHSLRIMVDWLSTNPLPYFCALVAGDSHGTFDLLLDRRRDEQVLFGQPRPSSGARFYDVWASFKAADAPQAPVGAFSPIDYRVDTAIADDLSLEGATTLRLKVLRGGDRVVPLELSRNLAVQGVKTEDGRPLAFFQNEDLGRRELLRRATDAVLVILPEPARAGEEIHLRVSYRGSVINDAGNGVEFVGAHETWYAHATGGDTFVPFDLSFRWPKRYTLVATGTKIESNEDAESKSGRWRSEVPFSFVGFNLGEYKMEAVNADRPTIQLYANKQLEDSILAQLQRNHVSALQKLPPITARPESVPFVITPPPPPSPADVLKQLGREILDSVRFYETINGPFPFSNLEISQIPGSFGQGWPGLIYLSTYAFLPPETQESAGLNELEQEEAHDLMPFHEVAHQWWGNVTGSGNYRDGWIEEGMANYLALLYLEHKRPGDHPMKKWLDRYRTALTSKEPGAEETPDEAGPLILGARLDSSKAPGAYSAVVYGKGTWVMHMLHEMMSDPAANNPDARFQEFLRSTLTDYRFRAITTANFQHAVEQHMTPSMDLEETRSMDWFFDEWVRGIGIPHYKVEFQTRPHGQGFLITGKLLQSGVDASFVAPVPLYAVRLNNKQERLGAVVASGWETHFRFVSRFRPAHILIDPQLTLLRRTD
jgi:hypothetical protein